MASSKGSVLVTGANGGLGSAIVSRLLATPTLAEAYTGLYTVRKAATATNLKSALGHAPPSHKHETLELDLGSLASVRKTAEDVNRRVASGELPRIRALILNAGYQDHTTLTISDDGFETSWQVNFLANQLLALLLLQSMDKETGRIVVVGSWSHDPDDSRNDMSGTSAFAGKWHDNFPGPEQLAKGKWSTPEDDPSWHAGYRRYGASKLCEVMLMYELSYRLARDPQLSNISVAGIDPGGMPSDLGRRGSFMFYRVAQKALMPALAPALTWYRPNGAIRTTGKSARDVVRLGLQMEVPKGEVPYLNGTEPLETAAAARDKVKSRGLWEYGIQMAGVRQGDTVLRDWQ